MKSHNIKIYVLQLLVFLLKLGNKNIFNDNETIQ